MKVEGCFAHNAKECQEHFKRVPYMRNFSFRLTAIIQIVILVDRIIVTVTKFVILNIRQVSNIGESTVYGIEVIRR